MKTYEQKMMDFLEVDGWAIDSIEREDLEWWADEIWKLKSTWAPNGAEAFLTFLVDPQYEGNRRKGQAVWGIGCSKQYPTSMRDAQACSSISFGKSFKKEIMDFQLNMESLRTNG